MSQIIRVQDDVYEKAKKLSEMKQETLSAFIANAVNAYEQQLFFAQLEEGYRSLKADPTEWSEELREREELDGTAKDGIDD